jgi:hypothetical protein
MDNQTIGGVVEVAPDDPTSEDLVISNRRTWQWIAIPDDAPGAGVRSPIVWTRYLPESRLIASGTWSTKTHPGAVDGAFAVTATPGATMRFTFEGDQAGLVVDTAYRSVLAVWIDGVRQENVIVPRRPGGARTLVVLPRASAEGQHRVRVTLLRGRLRLDGAGWLAPRTAHRPDKGCWNYYPSICVQETPTVLCDDIAERDFVIWFHLDPHGFDPDRDGIGCEA